MKKFPAQILGKPVVQKTYLVFSFNRDEMLRWCREKSIDPRNTIYVRDDHQVRGLNMEFCEIVDLGDWNGNLRKREAMYMLRSRNFNKK